MAQIQVEKIGGSVVITFDGGATVMLETPDALQLGMALMQVAALGGDTLDYDRPEEGDNDG